MRKEEIELIEYTKSKKCDERVRQLIIKNKDRIKEKNIDLYRAVFEGKLHIDESVIYNQEEDK